MPVAAAPRPAPAAYRLLLALLLMLLAAPAALAQATLTGRALDEATQAGLPFANVVLRAAGPAGRVVQAAVADEAGRFSLVAAPGGYQLQVLQLGFATLTRPVQVAAGPARLDLGDLALRPAAQGLGEVVVTGRPPLLEQKPDRVTMHVAGSLLAAGNSAYEVLAAAPGVQLIEGQPLRLRGKRGVVIYLNGKRLPGGTSLETLLASIPGEQLDRIELISNPSAKYDADATGGVVEIYTRQAQGRGWAGNVGGNFRQGYRSGGGANGGLRLSTPQFDLAASASYFRRGGFERSTGRRAFYPAPTGAPTATLTQRGDIEKVIQNRNFSASLNYHLSARTTLGLDADWQAGQLAGAGGAAAELTQPAGRSTSATQQRVLLREAFSNYTAFYRRELDSLHSSLLLSTNYATLHNTQQQDFNQVLRGPADSAARPSFFRNYIPAVYHISTTAADYTKVYAAGSRLEAGLKYTDTRNQSRQQAESLVAGTWQPQTLAPFAQLGYREQVAAGYLNASYALGKLSLQGGLRAERTHYRVQQGIDSSYFNLFPNLRADYKVSADYTASLAYAQNLTRPAYENLIPYERFQDSYTSQRGNARLRPEYTRSFSWNNLYRSYGLQLSYARTTGAISQVYRYAPATGLLTSTFQNLPVRHLATAVLTAPVAVAKWWNMTNSLTLSYQQLSYPDPFGEAAPLRRHQTTLSVSSDHTFTLGRGWSARVFGFYNSPSQDGLFDYAAYSYVVTSVKKTFLDKRAALTLSVVDPFYQLNFRVRTSVRPVAYTSLQFDDTRYVKLAFTYNLGQAGFKSKRIETNTNATERGRLGQ